MENGTGRPVGAAQIMSYSVPTPGATFGLRLNALNNRAYKIILTLKGVAAADRFEIEVAHFPGFNSSLNSFSKNKAHSYCKGDFRIKFDQVQRNILLEKSVRFNKARLIIIAIPGQELEDLMAAFNKSRYFIDLLNKINVLHVRTLNLFKEKLTSDEGFKAMTSAELAKDYIISLYHNLSINSVIKVPYGYVITEFPGDQM